jgi:hypothetical protein
MNKANSKHVIDMIDEHIKDNYESPGDLLVNVDAVGGYNHANKLVEGGDFLISYYDQRQFLDTLQLNNNSGREFTDDDVFKMYVLLVTRGIQRIYKQAKLTEVK